MIAATSTSRELAQLRAELGLSRERMARIFDVSAKSIERWERQETLPRFSDDLRRLHVLQQIVDLGKLVYGEEGVRSFLATPLPLFAGATAIQMVERGAGEEVIAALAADYEGHGP